jgi:hypothetical protein
MAAKCSAGPHGVAQGRGRFAVSQHLNCNRLNALGLIAEQRVRVISIDHGATIMRNRFKKAVIDDVTSRNIDTSLQENLLDLFESAMKSVATMLVREAKFDTTDFATAKTRSCEGFMLLVSRACANSCDGRLGAFQRGDECLDVVGHLE